MKGEQPEIDITAMIASSILVACEIKPPFGPNCEILDVLIKGYDVERAEEAKRTSAFLPV